MPIPFEGTYELIRDALRALNPYAVEIRYPGEGVTLTRAKRAVQLMATVRSFIREQIELR